MCNWALDLSGGQSYMLSQLGKKKKIPQTQPLKPLWVMPVFVGSFLEGVEDEGYISSPYLSKT